MVKAKTYCCTASLQRTAAFYPKVSTVFFRLSAVRLTLSAVIGVVGGVVLVMSWWRFGSVMACIVVVGLMLGFLIASTVLFTPLGRKKCFFPFKWLFNSKKSSKSDLTWHKTHKYWFILCVVLLLRRPWCVQAVRCDFLADVLLHHDHSSSLLCALA